MDRKKLGERIERLNALAGEFDRLARNHDDALDFKKLIEGNGSDGLAIASATLEVCVLREGGRQERRRIAIRDYGVIRSFVGEIERFAREEFADFMEANDLEEGDEE